MTYKVICTSRGRIGGGGGGVGGDGGVLGSTFAGYVLLASQSPYPILVYFVDPILVTVVQM